MKLTFENSRKLNLTGKEINFNTDLSNVVNSTVNKFLSPNISLEEQLKKCTEYLNIFSEDFDYVLIENNPLGVTLFETFFPKIKFLISWKKTNGVDHSHWHILERIKLRTV